MRRALVTGGAGFIGSNLVALLASRGHQVVVVDNLSSGCRENIPPRNDVTLVEGDVRDRAVLDDVMTGVDAVFHMAASVGNTRSIDDPILDSDVNVLGTIQVLEGARRHGVRKVVFSSSAGIFGELKTLPIGEDHAAEPDTPYGASKLCAEKQCLAYAKLYPLECVCLRYFNVYGVNQRYDAYGNVIPIFARRILRGEIATIYGDGEQTRDFVNVRDVAEANYRAASSTGVSGAFNVGSGTRITINALVTMMAAASEMTPTIQHRPPRKGDVRHSLADIRRAQAAIGYTPAVDLAEGLVEYMRWARSVLA
jgi:UDP-glucose 4-epimerase